MSPRLLAAAAALLLLAAANAESADRRAFPSPPSPNAPATVWAVGDGADGGEAGKAVAALIQRNRPARLLYLGDVYEHGTAAEFRDNYDTVYGGLASRTAPTPGNHEWPSHVDGYDAYWRAQTGVPTPPWYAFRVGGWTVLSLNSEARHGSGSPQVRWLRRRLERTRGTCVLAFWHRPYRSAGPHDDQPDVRPLWNALRGRAQLVISGHEHNMQRLRPAGGITQLIAGAGGHNPYPVGDDPRLAFADDSTAGALRLRLRPGSARAAFVGVDGAVLDRSRYGCSTGAPRRTTRSTSQTSSTSSR